MQKFQDMGEHYDNEIRVIKFRRDANIRYKISRTTNSLESQRKGELE